MWNQTINSVYYIATSDTLSLQVYILISFDILMIQ